MLAIKNKAPLPERERECYNEILIKKKILMLNQEQQIFEQIKKAKNILITFNKTWNGDSLASALAFYLVLKKMEKSVDVAAEKLNQGDVFNFLPSYLAVKPALDNLRKFIISLDITSAKVDKIKYKVEDSTLDFIISPKDGFFTHNDIKSRSGDFRYDLVISLDAPDLESLGSIYDNDTEFFYQVPIINIDHSSNNEAFGQINLIDLTAIATAEILFNLFTNYSRDLIDENVATCLLTGIIAKTKSFKTQNITPQALSISSQLVSMGARREEIVTRLYRSRSINVLKLWGRILARLQSSLENRLVWSTLSSLDFSKTETNEADLMEVIDELIINIPQAKIVVLIYETSANSIQALIYSVKNIDSLILTKKWNPVGTKSLAKITLSGSLETAEKELIAQITENMEKILD